MSMRCSPFEVPDYSQSAHWPTRGVESRLACPLARARMVDPVVAADGFSYERAAIERWLADGERASPVTREPLATLALLPNTTLRELIAELCAPGGASDGDGAS